MSMKSAPAEFEKLIKQAEELAVSHPSADQVVTVLAGHIQSSLVRSDQFFHPDHVIPTVEFVAAFVKGTCFCVA